MRKQTKVMSSLYDFDDKWTYLVEKAYSEDHGALTDHEKIWFNIQCLIEAVNNGALLIITPALLPEQLTIAFTHSMLSVLSIQKS